MLLSVVCVIWGRWVYRRGKKRYWQRVQNEHLMAYGAMDETTVGQGRSYSIGELYENKYFESEYEEANTSYTTKGDDDESSKSLSKDSSLLHPDQPDSHRNNGFSTISATTVTTVLRQDSETISNGTCTVDNISGTKKDETPLQEANGNTDGDEKSSQSEDKTSLTSEEAETQELSPEKVLVTDV